jgi:hypothetical protein
LPIEILGSEEECRLMQTGTIILWLPMSFGCGLFCPENISVTFLRNVGCYKTHTAPYSEDDILHSYKALHQLYTDYFKVPINTVRLL